MKALLLYAAIFVLILLVVPMLALGFDLQVKPDDQVPVHSPQVPAPVPDQPEPPQAEAVAEEDMDEPPLPDKTADEKEQEGDLEVPASENGVASFLILDESTGQVEEVSLRDFVRGAVAAEMPVSFHVEALKAQAVAAHTFALHNHLVQQEAPDPALKGADFSADPSNLLVYITEEQAKEFYGEAAERSWAKICEAADSVMEYVLEYDDEPIVAAYHAISAGQTEDAANVWTGSAPYLLPAESGGDLLAPDYESTATFTAEEVRYAIASAFPDIALGSDPAGWFGGIERSVSGYVVEIEVGDGALHGKDIRTLLDLRSHNFDLDYQDGVFTFRVYGYGHGVGLSQYGADFLARQGHTFDAILSNYYTGASLKKVALQD